MSRMNKEVIRKMYVEESLYSLFIKIKTREGKRERERVRERVREKERELIVTDSVILYEDRIIRIIIKGPM